MNKEDIFDSFPGIGNVITSDVVLAVSYLSDRNSQSFSVQFPL